MNILFICNEYPPGKSGGIGSVTRSLARELSAAGHQIFIAGLYLPGYGQKDYEEDQGIRVWRKRFGIDKGVLTNNYSFTDIVLTRLLKITGILKRDARKSVERFNDFVAQLIKEFSIDIVEWPDFNEYFRFFPPGFNWPPLPVPLIIKFHGTISYLQKQMGEPVDTNAYTAEKKHLARADALASVSRNTADNYMQFYQLNREITVLYNSIDLPPLYYSLNKVTPTIVYTGTLTKLKGIYSLLRAWNTVHKKYPGAVLRIFGKGHSQPLLGELSKDALPSVHFEGFVTRDELYKAMSTASAAIFPSYTECFAIAPLEAMAAGCPVIYTKRVSGPELINSGENGLLVEPDDYGQMAEAILLLLEDESLRKKFSEHGRETIVQKFDIRKSAADHIDFYSRVIQNYYKN